MFYPESSRIRHRRCASSPPWGSQPPWVGRWSDLPLECIVETDVGSAELKRCPHCGVYFTLATVVPADAPPLADNGARIAGTWREASRHMQRHIDIGNAFVANAPANDARGCTDREIVDTLKAEIAAVLDRLAPGDHHEPSRRHDAGCPCADCDRRATDKREPHDDC